MKVIQTTNYFLVALSFVCAIFLTIMPLPESILWFRPQWMLMVLLFWVITSPSDCGILLAFCIGLLTDLLTGTPPGQQAFIFVTVTYFVLKTHSIIAYAVRFQQSLMIGVCATLAVLLQSIILGFTGHHPHTLLNVLSVLTTMLLWPALFVVLDSWRPRAYL